MPAGQVQRLGVGQTDQRVDEDLEDLLGRVVGHRLDVHAAFAAGHHGHALGGPVGERGDVVLVPDVGAFFDQQPAHLLAHRAGLVRDQLHAQDLPGQLFDLVERARQLDAAALAATAGMDLRLDHPDGPTELLRCLGRLQHREGWVAARHWHAEVAKDVLALVLVNLHGWARAGGVTGSLRADDDRSPALQHPESTAPGDGVVPAGSGG